MNWLDIAIVVSIVGGAVMGWRTGLVQAAVSIIGIFVGFVVAGRVSGPIANLLTDTVGSASIAQVAAYAIIGFVVFIATQIVGHILTGFLKAIFLGWLNTLAGALFGAFAGFLLGAVIVAMMARLAFLTPSPLPGGTQPTQVRENIQSTLKGSRLVPVYLALYDRLPPGTLGMTPGAFQQALEELKRVRATQ